MQYDLTILVFFVDRISEKGIKIKKYIVYEKTKHIFTQIEWKLCSYQRCDLKGKTVDDSLLPAIFRIKKLELK